MTILAESLGRFAHSPLPKAKFIDKIELTFNWASMWFFLNNSLSIGSVELEIDGLPKFHSLSLVFQQYRIDTHNPKVAGSSPAPATKC
jgi:hypothetical protein